MEKEEGPRETHFCRRIWAPFVSTLGSSFLLTLALSFPICTGEAGLGASLGSAVRRGPELVNSRAGCPPQLVKGGLVAGGPL